VSAEAFAPADLGTEDGPLLLDEPGLYDIPEADYHRDPLRHLGGSLSSTTARKLLPPSCPALARHAVDNPEHKDAYDLGSVTHRLTLGSGCPIVHVPADTWQTKAAREAREEARAAGAVALLTKDLDKAYAMRDAVHADSLAHALLTMPGAPEQTLIWREGGTWCRAMLDRWIDPKRGLAAIVDLKTTPDVSDEHLQRAVWNFGYHQQEDLYRRGYQAVHGEDADFYFVFVQADPPHMVRVVQLDEQLRAIARQRNDEALQVWRDCQKSGEWPAYPPVGDIALIGPPRWARTREDYY
jgi:hypothetical protein